MKNESKKDESRSELTNTFTVSFGNKLFFPLFSRSKGDLLKMILFELENKQKIWIATVNPEFVMTAKKNNLFLKILQEKTSYNVVDGIGLIWATKVNNIFSVIKIGGEILQGKHREDLITGADLMNDLCRVAEKKNQTVYFLGGWDDRSERTAKYFLKKYPKLKVIGYSAENFDFKKKTDYLFVAMGMEKQEMWINKNYDKLKVGLVMGVGRSFDYYSGALTRAPKWVQKMGMEWLFSLMMEPKRWKRQLQLPKFIWLVLKKFF